MDAILQRQADQLRDFAELVPELQLRMISATAGQPAGTEVTNLLKNPEKIQASFENFRELRYLDQYVISYGIHL